MFRWLRCFILASAGITAFAQDLLWEVRLDDSTIRDVAVLDNGAALAGADGGGVYKIDRNGKTIWKTKVDRGLRGFGGLALHPNGVLFVSAGGNVS